MKYTGTVRDGVVVLKGSPLKEGTVVLVEEARGHETEPRGLKKFRGAVRSLPRDMARNHDHYLHGQSAK